MAQLGSGNQQLKRIVQAVDGPVIIPDLGVFLRNKGDSRDLLATDAAGKVRISVEDLTKSNDLDGLITAGKLRLYDENGTQLTGTNALRATNLATLYNSGTGGGGDSYRLFQEVVSVSSNGQTSFSLSNTPAFPDDVLVFVNGNKQENTDFSIVGTTLTWSGFSLKTTDSTCFVYEITV